MLSKMGGGEGAQIKAIIETMQVVVWAWHARRREGRSWRSRPRAS